MTKLYNKKILLFSTKFFMYDNAICQSIRKLGGSVLLFDERPNNSVLVKALIRINRSLISLLTKRYHNQLIRSISTLKFDYIIVINGESFSAKTILKLKREHAESVFILYFWDSVNNINNALSIKPYFDKVFSFDRFDSKKYNMKFLPLFYIDEYKKLSTCNNSNNDKYSLLFVGTIHSDRYKIISRIKDSNLYLNNNFFTYMYFSSKLLYYKLKYINKSLDNSRLAEFNFIPLTHESLIEYLKNFNVVLDIQHPDQQGLTMRTFESLAARKKLITTNKDIVNYDFYVKENIYILDRNNPIIDIDFFNSEYFDLNPTIVEKYYIDNWLINLIK